MSPLHKHVTESSSNARAETDIASQLVYYYRISYILFHLMTFQHLKNDQDALMCEQILAIDLQQSLVRGQHRHHLN
jgi:hypothetical protein